MNEGIQTLKWLDQASQQGVAEMHPEPEGQKNPVRTAAEDADTRRGLKRSAELPLDDGARDRAPGRGERLFLMCCLSRQLCSKLDAAVKMEMISRKAAKITNSAAA